VFLEVLKFVTAWRCLRYKHAKKTKKNARMSNERDEIMRTMTGKSGSREKKRTFLSLLSKNNDENINEKKFSWGPLWDSPTRITKQKEEDKAARPPNTLAAFALTTPSNEPARERKNFVAKENAEDENNNKTGEDQGSFLEASLGGGFSANATGDEDEEEETMKDETMTMAKEEKQNGGARLAAAAEKVGEILLSRTLASKPPMKGFAFIKSSEFEQFKENWQRQKVIKGKKKTEHASMIPRGPPPPPLEQEKKKKKRRTTASSNDDDDGHQNSPKVVLRGHVYSVVVPSSAPSSESSSTRATREEKNRRQRSFLVKLEAQFGDNGQKWQALEAYVSPAESSSS